MLSDCDLKIHCLVKWLVEALNGLFFATFSQEVEPLTNYLGPHITKNVDRIMCRPIKILGNQRQFIHGNWKLYAENTRDPYHASLLHLFHNTFGLYRSTQTGECLMDESKRHSFLYSKADRKSTRLNSSH